MKPVPWVMPPPLPGVLRVEMKNPELSYMADPKKSKFNEAAEAEAAMARGRMVLPAEARAEARDVSELVGGIVVL